MIRKLMHKNKKENEQKRNYEIQRIETFSDGVFAFAVTLLIVSLEVPKNFEELMINVRGFFAFGISFSILVLIWNEQHKFFRKYGLDDSWTIALNVALLFLVLFYVYPLKFLFTLVFSNEIYAGKVIPLKITDAQVPLLFQIYAAGYIAIYFLFTLMYVHVSRKADFLEFTAIEKFDCKTNIYKQLIMVSVGICSIICSLTVPAKFIAGAGFVYVLIGPALTLYFFFRTKLRKKYFVKNQE